MKADKPDLSDVLGGGKSAPAADVDEEAEEAPDTEGASADAGQALIDAVDNRDAAGIAAAVATLIDLHTSKGE